MYVRCERRGEERRREEKRGTTPLYPPTRGNGSPLFPYFVDLLLRHAQEGPRASSGPREVQIYTSGAPDGALRGSVRGCGGDIGEIPEVCPPDVRRTSTGQGAEAPGNERGMSSVCGCVPLTVATGRGPKNLEPLDRSAGAGYLWPRRNKIRFAIAPDTGPPSRRAPSCAGRTSSVPGSARPPSCPRCCRPGSAASESPGGPA